MYEIDNYLICHGYLKATIVISKYWMILKATNKCIEIFVVGTKLLFEYGNGLEQKIIHVEVLTLWNKTFVVNDVARL